MYKRILVPLDGSRLAEQALPHAAIHAEKFGAEIVLLMVLGPLPEPSMAGRRIVRSAEEATAELAQDYLVYYPESPVADEVAFGLVSARLERDERTGLRLYVNRVFIMDAAQNLLPREISALPPATRGDRGACRCAAARRRGACDRGWGGGAVFLAKDEPDAAPRWRAGRAFSAAGAAAAELFREPAQPSQDSGGG